MTVRNVTLENFQNEVLNSKEKVLIDFYAQWCPPCKKMGPIVSEIADERTDIKVCKIDVDEQPELAMQFNVSSIPAFVVIKDGKVTGSSLGAMPKENLLKII